MQALNRVQLIGLLPRDPEMRFTPSGTPVTSFTVLTYRGWTDDSGQKQESPEYTNIVVWSKLAEICNQLLHVGSKVFIEGRLQTRSWEDQEGQKRYKTELIADDMVLLSGRSEPATEPSSDQMRIPAGACLNRVQLIGNMARDPELRYLPSGTPVATFVTATNRSWTNAEGVKQESTEFHNIVCWNATAERIATELKKGQKVYIEGRLQNRSWEGQDGVKRYKTETVGQLIIGATTSTEGAGFGASDQSVYDDGGDFGPAGGSDSSNSAPTQDSSTTDDQSVQDDDLPF